MNRLLAVGLSIGLAFPASVVVADHQPLRQSKRDTPTLLSGWGWILRWAFLPELYRSTSGILNSYVTVTAIAESDRWTFRYRLRDGREFTLPESSDLIAPLKHTVELRVTSDPAEGWNILAIPAFGVKVDAVPGMLATSWFEVARVGRYDGNCAGGCDGRDVPFAVEVIGGDAFDAWVSYMHAKHGTEGR